MIGKDLALIESYGTGLRRRLRDGGLTAAAILVSCLLIYAVHELTHSTSLALAVAVLCGVGTERLVSLISPIVGIEDITKSGKMLWLALLGPCILILAGYLIYSIAVGTQGTQLFGAELVGLLLGSIASATYRVIAERAPA